MRASASFARVSRRCVSGADWRRPAAGVAGAGPRQRAGSGAQHLQVRGRSSAAAAPTTELGAYLQRCGAIWGELPRLHEVDAADDGRSFLWSVELPPEWLKSLRGGELLESPPFSVGPNRRARFQLYPKGDEACATEGMCSLWLCTDAPDSRQIRLHIGGQSREGGASEFCKLQDVLQEGKLQVGLQVHEAAEKEGKPVPVQQRLHLTGLEKADWQVFGVDGLLAAGDLVTSPPFRFHHVLLGDMYLELRPGVPHAEHCQLFFRCRVPTMQLQVKISVGDAFSKSFIAQGRSTPEEDAAADRCLGINMQAPGVLRPDGSMAVSCTLEEVVKIPNALRDLIPKLDERVHWPKRL